MWILLLWPVSNTYLEMDRETKKCGFKFIFIVWSHVIQLMLQRYFNYPHSFLPLPICLPSIQSSWSEKRNPGKWVLTMRLMLDFYGERLASFAAEGPLGAHRSHTHQQSGNAGKMLEFSWLKSLFLSFHPLLSVCSCTLHCKSLHHSCNINLTCTKDPWEGGLKLWFHSFEAHQGEQIKSFPQILNLR